MNPKNFFGGFAKELPRIGNAGSRSAWLHAEDSFPSVVSDPGVVDHRAFHASLNRFQFLRALGTLGVALMVIGGLGAGALPVVENPYSSFPYGSIMSRMLLTATMLCFVGIGCLVISWLLMAPLMGVSFRRGGIRAPAIPLRMVITTCAAWTLPFLLTAPMFTQDIYSYIANGSIISQGMDPYSAGPVDLLGTENPLARSVPFIWSHSPSPYGPVALGLAAAISHITSDSIVGGVIAHRILSLSGLVLAGWAMTHLSRRSGVSPQAALWLGLLNPLTIIHLVAGIHNESYQLGFLLAGVELALRGINAMNETLRSPRGWGLVVASGFLISCAGMVKVTGFIGLGFTGMALAQHFLRRRSIDFATASFTTLLRSIVVAGAIQAIIAIASIALVTVVTGIGLGWVTGQGGAVSIRSWMSTTTAIGVISGWISTSLGLGDHTEAALEITRLAGILIAGVFMIRMLFGTIRGRISCLGGLGVATFVLVLCFPVVHPWYALWAILPLAAWANRPLFRTVVAIYSVIISFFVLPRGLGLPPSSVLSIYAGAFACLILLFSTLWFWLRKRHATTLL